MDTKDKKFKEFKPTSWSIDNKTSIYVLAIIISIFGIISYNNIPKEQFPEIVIPTILVNTIYPGTSPTDMENLVTRLIEKNIKSISGVKKITSRSFQDYSSIVVEFNTDIEVSDAKQKVKDAVDKTLPDLPNDLLADPSVMEIDFSEFPIMNLNLSGDYDLVKIKKYADILQDKIESLKEITRVDIVGALDREIHINADMYKMQAASVTFGEIERAIAYENLTIASGSIEMQGVSRSIRVVGEIKDIETIKNIVVNSSSGAQVRLKEIATVEDSFKEQESFARLNKKNVITLNVIKKSGQNLINAADKIKEIIEESKDVLPKDLEVTISGDQSYYTRTSLFDLNNTIIIGFILVTIVLMFFMGLTNAIFVGLSVPLSMALAYIVMPGIGFTMNMLVMFSFIFALGIVVDDAIVVIENTHRIYKKTKMDIVTAAKFAAGEVFLPILSGTLTTIAPFFPLAFWPGVVGKFMFFIPITLIITLFASLIVAYIINPVFAIDFMTKDEEDEKLMSKKKIFTYAGFIAGIAAIFYMSKLIGIGNFIIFIDLIFIFHNIWGAKFILNFQKKIIPRLMNNYENLLKWCLVGSRPYKLLAGMVVLFFATIILTGIAKPRVVFFPEHDPSNIFVYVKLPVGTAVNVTDSVAEIVEERVNEILGDSNSIVESIITNVALGASENMFDNTSKSTNLAKITINFVEYSKRKGVSTSAYLDKIRSSLKGIPGAVISVNINQMGPPTGKPVNIEISGESIDEINATALNLKKYLDSLNIPGIEELKTDFEKGKPEIIIDIDRERANLEGISTGQIGMEIRTAINGKEISKYREGEDQYPIILRYSDDQRLNIDKIMNLKITYRDMNTGLLRQIPASAVAKVRYTSSYGGINRKNVKRLISLASNLLNGYTTEEVMADIQKVIPGFKKPIGVEINLTGEKEDQAESMGFLSMALLLSLFLILFILISQFNSISKPLIILSEVFFSIIGVLLGYIIFGMTISIIMTGIGIVALVGIVVRNGILLVEFTDVLKERGLKTRDAIVQAGKTRITPVLLTATATILGLIPLAIGFNIDFVSLFTHLNPHIHFGGDNVAFFGPLAWTIIFGLSFATFLTLILVPVMYFIAYASKVSFIRTKHRIKIKK